MQAWGKPGSWILRALNLNGKLFYREPPPFKSHSLIQSFGLAILPTSSPTFSSVAAPHLQTSGVFVPDLTCITALSQGVRGISQASCACFGWNQPHTPLHLQTLPVFVCHFRDICAPVTAFQLWFMRGRAHLPHSFRVPGWHRG